MASWLRIPDPILKKCTWKRLLDWFKKSNCNWKDWKWDSDSNIRTHLASLIPHKNSLEFCLGLWAIKIPPPCKKWEYFLFIQQTKDEPTHNVGPWECVRVL